MKTSQEWSKHFFEQGLLQSTGATPVFSWQYAQMFHEVQQDAIIHERIRLSGKLGYAIGADLKST